MNAKFFLACFLLVGVLVFSNCKGGSSSDSIVTDHTDTAAVAPAAPAPDTTAVDTTKH